MSPATHNEPLPKKKLADEFASWPMTPAGVSAADMIRRKFDELLDLVTANTPPHNGRYLSIVKTKLEETSFFAVKGIAKPS